VSDARAATGPRTTMRTAPPRRVGGDGDGYGDVLGPEARGNREETP
jgi:hypothetical protein